MKRQIPNIVTLLNLLSGCIAITMAFAQNYEATFYWIIVAAGFDFFDGLSARLLNVSSKLGVELDSLADVVSFGVAPAMALYMMLQSIVGNNAFEYYIPFSAFLIPIFSAYRLAKFNIDDRQSTSFLGLPTPANGLFWISYTYALSNLKLEIDTSIIIYISVALVISLSALMISEIPMFSLKIKEFTIRKSLRQIITTVLTITFVAIWGISGVALGIISYILISLCSIKRV